MKNLVAHQKYFVSLRIKKLHSYETFVYIKSPAAILVIH